MVLKFILSCQLTCVHVYWTTMDGNTNIRNDRVKVINFLQRFTQTTCLDSTLEKCNRFPIHGKEVLLLFWRCRCSYFLYMARKCCFCSGGAGAVISYTWQGSAASALEVQLFPIYGKEVLLLFWRCRCNYFLYMARKCCFCSGGAGAVISYTWQGSVASVLEVQVQLFS